MLVCYKFSKTSYLFLFYPIQSKPGLVFMLRSFLFLSYCLQNSNYNLGFFPPFLASFIVQGSFSHREKTWFHICFTVISLFSCVRHWCIKAWFNHQENISISMKLLKSFWNGAIQDHLQSKHRVWGPYKMQEGNEADSVLFVCLFLLLQFFND